MKYDAAKRYAPAVVQLRIRPPSITKPWTLQFVTLSNARPFAKPSISQFSSTCCADAPLVARSASPGVPAVDVKWMSRHHQRLCPCSEKVAIEFVEQLIVARVPGVALFTV